LKNELLRVQKYISECGIASRRKAEELIIQKKVKINGRYAEIGDSINPKIDVISVNGTVINKQSSHRYIMLHKPRGFVTTMSDELGRRCVAQLVADIDERVYPVGRLDKDSEGLLLMTNDGEFHNAITHPKTHIAKTYRVTVRPRVTEDQLTAMAVGMETNGDKTPTSVKVLRQEQDKTVLEIILHEGKNRQIRRMCEDLNLEVARLKRVAEGSIKLGMLAQGKWRDLKKEEIDSLFYLISKNQSNKPGIK
jgi:23S rRNA pseudouridine2605 synthase